MPPRTSPSNDMVMSFIWKDLRAGGKLIPEGTMVWLEHPKSVRQLLVGELKTITEGGNLQSESPMLRAMEKRRGRVPCLER